MIKGLREKVLAKVPLVCQASASTSLALWRSNVRDLEHRGERPSPSQLAESLILMTRNFTGVADVLRTRKEVARQLGNEWGWEQIYDTLLDEAADWIHMPKATATAAPARPRRRSWAAAP